MNHLDQFVPALRATLKKCIEVLKSPSQLDINAYLVAERESVEAGEALLKAIDAWEKAAPARAATITIDTGRREFVQMCMDILCQAQYSACGYWAVSRNEVLDEGEEFQVLSAEFKPHDNEGPAFKNDDPRNNYKKLDRAALTEAMARIINEPTLCRPDIRACVMQAFFEADASNIDDEICDVIIQIALFGEIVFG